jgi:opacity protein-like surface antigen
MFAANWSTKLEYLYTDYGSVSNSFVSAAPFSTILNSDLHNHVVRAGVNYHFGG